MSDKRKFNAHINRKGLDATGITEDHIRGMGSRLGQSTMLIVEAKHLSVTTDAEGTVVLALALQSVEPVPAEHDEMVRQFQRGLYLSRPEQEGQAVLGGTAGKNAEDLNGAAAALGAAVEKDENGAVTGIWDGDTDGPLTAVPEGPFCPAKGCGLPEDHDGDHDPVEPDEDEPEE